MGDVVDLGFAMKRVSRADFDAHLLEIRLVHRKNIQHRTIVRDGRTFGIVILVDENPVAFTAAADGTRYIRAV